jgi:hypothetical protein
MLHACLNLVFSKTRYSPSRKRRRRWRFTKNIENKTKKRKKKKMAKKFFPDEWEKISAEEMIRARARLSGFIESIPEKDKAIRDVSIKR